MLPVRDLIPQADVALLTIDSLRYDVAVSALDAGETPHLAALLPGGVWEKRHTPGSFTFAAHQAFLAGFLPTPAAPGRHPRLFAAQFEGSTSTASQTFTFAEANLPAALAARGYRTVCVGGVGFFNGRTALGQTLPAMFQEAHWSPASGVKNPASAAAAVRAAVDRLRAIPERVFLLLNFAATHTPTHYYLPGERRDSPESQRAALRTVDAALPLLLDTLRERGPTLLIVCADHGTCHGEDGYWGHRVAHPLVWTVPYMETVLEGDI
ncbi:STM4013/SEN3800 family hydrolase [Deinococcus lacus]|uniref:STM4013/SEN3800 family hydrolase n=1 Tax=Deinococcus lacus TaxID=392561 RepID=A0ABW1YHY5_9DEIO